jgi:hypothetical protein
MELHNNSTTVISNGSQRSDESGSIIRCTEAHVQANFYQILMLMEGNE